VDLWPAVVAVGFGLTTAFVIVLARRSTARWERQRTSVWRRRFVPPPPAASPPVRPVGRFRAALVRGAAATLVRTRSLRDRVRSAGPARSARGAPSAPGPDPRPRRLRRMVGAVRSLRRRPHGFRRRRRRGNDPRISRDP